MLDRDLAELYGVETKVLKQAARRNIKRFPPDFMFELTKEELKNWRSQFVTSNSIKMGLRHLPMAFTEQGVVDVKHVAPHAGAWIETIEGSRFRVQGSGVETFRNRPSCWRLKTASVCIFRWEMCEH